MVVLHSRSNRLAVKRVRRIRVASAVRSFARNLVMQSSRINITPSQINAALAVLVVSLSFVVFGASVAERLVAGAPVVTRTVRVQRGDTLWALANRYGNPNEYILSRVERLADENHLRKDVSLQPGQILTVHVHPASAGGGR